MKILLVEDSPEVSLITVEYLLELGHQPVAVPDAEAALGKVEGGPFDVVMTDVSLPGMSGIALARELLTRHSRLPIIIASGYGALSVEAILVQNPGRVFMLQKPYDMATLERTLAQAVGNTP